MPTDLSGLLVILFGVLPGYPGHSLYRRLVGAYWRQPTWETIIGIVGFSSSGLALYVMVAVLVGAPMPIYLIPSSLRSISGIEQELLLGLSVAFIGHIAASTVAAALVAFFIRKTNRWLPDPHPNTWNQFVNVHSQKHWVVVKTIDGDAYAGMIGRANVSVPAEERDIIITEPAKYRDDVSNYIALGYQHLFLPARLVESIATMHDPELETRITKVDQTIVSGEIQENNDE